MELTEVISWWGWLLILGGIGAVALVIRSLTKKRSTGYEEGIGGLAVLLMIAVVLGLFNRK